MRKLFILFFLFSPCALFAQHATDSATKISDWSFTASGYYYFVPYNNTLMLTGYADHRSLHLEARYNYEDQNTVSAFAGWTFEFGKQIQFDVKPMMGILAGGTKGVAPALETSISYKCFDLYAESEYVIDMKGNNSKENSNNNFYAWRELAITPIKCLRTGIIGQTTRLFSEKTHVQRGIFAEYSFWKLTAGAYYFRSRSANNFVISSLSVHF